MQKGAKREALCRCSMYAGNSGHLAGVLRHLGLPQQRRAKQGPCVGLYVAHLQAALA